jgi:hypothetical protein
VIIGQCPMPMERISACFTYRNAPSLRRFMISFVPVAYPDLSQRFAMKIGGRRTLEEMYPADFDKFAGDIEIRAPFIRRRMKEMAEAVLGSTDVVMSTLALPPNRQELLQEICNIITSRAKFLLDRLDR